MFKKTVFLAIVGAASSLAVATPAAASEGADALKAAFDGTPMTDSELGALRGGAGLFSFLPTGSTTSIQIGDTTTSSHQDGSPSSATSSLTSGGTTATASASLGGAVPPSLSFSRSFSTTSSVTRTRSFSFGF